MGNQVRIVVFSSTARLLIKEKEFRAFRKTLAERKDIEWIFLSRTRKKISG